MVLWEDWLGRSSPHGETILRRAHFVWTDDVTDMGWLCSDGLARFVQMEETFLRRAAALTWVDVCTWGNQTKKGSSYTLTE